MGNQPTEDTHQLLERLRQNYEDYLADCRRQNEVIREEMQQLICLTFNERLNNQFAQLTNLRYWAPRFELQSETANQCPICSIAIDGIKPDHGWVNHAYFAEKAAEMSANYSTIKFYWERLGFDVKIQRNENKEFNGTIVLQIVIGWLGNSKRGHPRRQ